MATLGSPLVPVPRAGIVAAFAGGPRRRGAVLDADAAYRGTVLDADALAPRLRAWDNDPAYADRVGLYRAGGPFMALNDKPFANVFTFSRASKAWDFDAYGLLGEVAQNAIRQGYDPATGLPAGWLIEGAVTNSFSNPRAEGAVPGVIGSGGVAPTGWSIFSVGITSGLIIEIVGAGLEDGIPYCDIRFHTGGVAMTSPGVGQLWFHSLGATITAAEGETWTIADYVRLVAGSLANVNDCRLVLIDKDAGNVYLRESSAAFTPTSAPLRAQRFAHTRTLGTGTGILGGGLRLNVAANSMFDVTLRVGAPQITRDYRPSSVVLPPAGSPAASTRAADSLSIEGGAFTALFGPGASQGCVICDVLLPQTASAVSTQAIATIYDGVSGNNRIVLRNGAGGATVSGNVVVGGSSAGTTASAGTVTPDVPFRAGLRWDATTIAVCLNGGTVQSVAPASLPTRAALMLGNTPGGTQPLNGRLRLVRALAYAPSDAEFQSRCVLGAN